MVHAEGTFSVARKSKSHALSIVVAWPRLKALVRTCDIELCTQLSNQPLFSRPEGNALN